MKKTLVILVTIFWIFTSFAQKNTVPSIGIRGGIGTDINLGLAYGAGINYLVDYNNKDLELGVLYFGGNYKESTKEGRHTYNETTDLSVMAILANYLIKYTPYQNGIFFISGVGIASVYVEWEEKSPTDISLGIPLSNGGSMQSSEGNTGGTILNLGIGKSFFSGADIRAEMPVIITFSPPGKASSVAPSFITTLGFRF